MTPDRTHPLSDSARRLRLISTLSCLPILVYALIRFLQAEVYMDAERSFLLFLLPFLVGTHTVFGTGRKQLRLLLVLIAIDLGLLGLYGIINHFVAGNARALWAEGYPQYQLGYSRATGSYFCPDHFSGIMELATCIGLGLLLARGTGKSWKFMAVPLLVIGVSGVLLSKSRGGALSLAAVVVAALIWGFNQWPLAARWCWRLSLSVILLLGVIGLWHFDKGYANRFTSYFTVEAAGEHSLKDLQSAVARKLRGSCRGRMMSTAVRAWRSHPIVGIGPGMHRNLWFHFAASSDGDREVGRWPTYVSTHFHSYYAHNDWLQLLEEYGLIGFVLFLVPASTLFALLLKGVRKESVERRRHAWHPTGNKHHGLVLAGLFAFVCMAFHSLGDFNLQMPATGWLFAAILAMPVAHILGEEGLEP